MGENNSIPEWLIGLKERKKDVCGKQTLLSHRLNNRSGRCKGIWDKDEEERLQ